MPQHAIFIDGSEGTTGLQIRERLAGRSDIELLILPEALRKDVAARAKKLNEADLVILCLPDGAAQESVGLIKNPKVRVIDASTAHRINPNWVYGFPELSSAQEEVIRTARFVSNPGCYATGAIALLAPLIMGGLSSSDTFFPIIGTSGYSGAGRKAIDLCEGRGDTPQPSGMELYALGAQHKHVPEIMEFAGLTRTPLFTPAINNQVYQGMLVEIPVSLAAFRKAGSQMSAHDLHAHLLDHYQAKDNVRVMPFSPDSTPSGRLALEGLAGKDHMELYVVPYKKSQAALLIARLDNLGKGASGAAVRNMSLMLG